jgi:hypothetical protein
VRARIGLALAGVVIATVALAVERPWKAPEAARQAGLAKADAIWRQEPAAQTQPSSTFTDLADAAWVPWADRATIVGRWYPVRDKPATIAAWEYAAQQSGWVTDDRCGHGVYTKRLGQWPAPFVVGHDPTGIYLGVRIVFPSPTGSGCA